MRPYREKSESHCAERARTRPSNDQCIQDEKQEETIITYTQQDKMRDERRHDTDI